MSLFLSTVSQVNHSSSSSLSLDTVDVESCTFIFSHSFIVDLFIVVVSVGDVAVTCVQKLKVINALQEAVENENKGSTSKAIDAHSHWLNGNQAEYAYKQGS